MQNNLPTDKNAIRIQRLSLRQRVEPAEVAAAGQSVAGYIISMISDNSIVAGYCPMRGELDISFTTGYLASRGNLLCLPVIEASDKPLYFRKWIPGEALEKGRYGVDVPPVDAPVLRPDTLLVPLVAFDRSGSRLGYGAGYYDRTIEKLRRMQGKVQVIGVGYSFQEVSFIEPEPHDQKLDVIVTEKGVIEIP